MARATETLPHAAALAAAQDAEACLRQACTLAGQAVTTLSTALQSPVEAPLNSPNEDPVARHRRLHRPGISSKIEADPDLRAFIVARIESMTFDALVQAIAEAFPPERRVRRSSLHRWWQTHCKRGTASTGNYHL